MLIGNRKFDTDNNIYIMGILNVTPDSFSDGGKYMNVDHALRQVDKMIQDGADIIDIGGQSTRPGFNQVEDTEEIKRVLPVIKEIKKRYDIPVSVDTFYSSVAREALYEGVEMINDICSLRYQGNKEHMADVIREFDASAVIMHNSERRYEASSCDDEAIESNLNMIMDEIKLYIDTAKISKIADDKIIIDPGVGFAKDYHMNMAVLAHLDKIKEFGYPVLLGASNKSFIGETLDICTSERTAGTIATSLYALTMGAAFVRVHDVAANKQAITMAKSILAYK